MPYQSQGWGAWDQADRKIEGMRAVMQKVVRILSGRMLRIQAADGEGFYEEIPAWTTGDDIFFNHAIMRDLMKEVQRKGGWNSTQLVETVGKFRGLTFHELGHVLFTPTDDMQIVRSVKNHFDGTTRLSTNEIMRKWWAFNALEDQRMEQLFNNMYPATEPYFTSAVAEWLTKTPESLKQAFILLHGRRYLPLKLRQQARIIFAQQFGVGVASDFARVIDDYSRCIFPGDDRKGYDCVLRFVELMVKVHNDGTMSQPNNDGLPQHGEAGQEECKRNKSKASPESRRQDQQDAQVDFDEDEDDTPQASQGGSGPDWSDHDDEEADEEGNGDGSGDDQDDDPEAGTDADADGTGGSGDDEDGDDDSDSAGNGTDSGDTGADDSDSDSDGDADQPGDSDADGQPGGDSAGQEGGLGNTPNDLLDLAEQLVDAMADDAQIAQDVENTIRSMREQVEGGGGLGVMQFNYKDANPPGAARSMVRRVQKELTPIRMELEAEKIYRTPNGKLNTRRAATAPSARLDVFDQMQTDTEEQGGIEVVIDVDLSGSMDGQMPLVSEILWICKTALDRLDIPCTVLGFSNDWCVMYQPGEKASKVMMRNFASIAGTVPVHSFRAARDILIKSDQPNRLLVTVTDGMWSTSNEWDKTHARASWDPLAVDDEVRPVLNELHRNQTTTMLLGLRDYGDSQGPVQRFGLHCHEVGYDIDGIEGLPMAMAVMVKRILRQVSMSWGH